MNIAESERMRAMLAGERDLVVVNSCAVTGEAIALAELRYWSADRQEPYASCEIATRRLLGLDPA